MSAAPALRARHLDNHYALQRAIVTALGEDAGEAFAAEAAASACLAALHTALVRWAEDDGRDPPPDLLAIALTTALGADVLDG
jgi:hypothetical protein